MLKAVNATINDNKNTELQKKLNLLKFFYFLIDSFFKDLLVGILKPTNQKLNTAEIAKIIRTTTFSIKAGEIGINDNDIVNSIIVWAYNFVLKVIPFPFLKSSTYLPNFS